MSARVIASAGGKSADPTATTTVSSCADCGAPAADAHAVLLVQSITVHGKAHHFALCGRCTLRRGQLDQQEIREQLERQHKAVT